MEPVTTAALIGGAASALGSGANVVATGKMNKKTRAWNEKMYAIQQRDNLANWHLQNSYNSPEAQMARLQAAGLNPNLVYGNGTVTGNTSSAPDTPHAMPYRPDAPNFDVPDVVGGYFNAKIQHQTLSNQKKQGDILALEAMEKAQDLRSKTNLNDYMESKGFTYKGEKERGDANLTGEKHFTQMLLNAYNQGGEGVNAPPLFEDGAYSLQLKSMKTLEALRRLEMQGKGFRNTSDKVRSQYLKRTMSGELKDMSAKDIITLLIQGIGLTK